LDESCRDLAQCCEKVREEVYRHLMAVESSRISILQMLYAVLTVTIGAIFTVVAGVFTLVPNLLQLQTSVVIIISMVLASLAICFLVKSMHSMEEVKEIKTIIRKSNDLHLNNFVQYFDMLENCCTDLKIACPNEEVFYCFDLNKLREIANDVQRHLEKK